MLAAGSAVAAQQANTPTAPTAPRGRGSNAPPEVLKTKAMKYADLKPSGTGARTLASIVNGVTTRGLQLEMHLSDLGPGLAPHPPHQNVKEEILIVIEGMLDVELFGKVREYGLPPEKGGGQVTRLEPGGVAYMSSNDMHGWRNPGTTTCRYMVLTIG
jgi:quercetin dioxygenase-like cupin family protein